MPLQNLQFRAGITKDITDYSNSGGWYDCDLIRFRMGFPETVGGWQKYSGSQFIGSCRCLHQWTTLEGINCTGVGTESKLYVETGGVYFDITPIRRTVTLGVDPLETEAIGTNRVIVTDVANGCVLGDYVTFSGATAFDNYTIGMLNTEHVVAEVVDDDTYVIEITGAVSAGAGVTGGGAAVVAAYQINVGPNTQVFGTGWGTGTWGRGTWGSASTSGVSTGQLRVWSMDNFGEDLVACVRGGGIYYWTASTGTSVRAVALSDLAGSNQAPTIGAEVFVSDLNRSIVVLGANENGSATQDLMLIRWCSSEDATEWEPTRETTAGSYRLSSGSQIITGIRAREETAIWTDKTLFTMQFVGPPYTFGFTLMGENVSIVGPNAAAEARNTLFWMDINEFKVYTGSVSSMPCTVQNYVFDDINLDQRYKIVCGTNVRYNEIWWFYPSAASSENDRYVTFNYIDGVWAIGSLERTFWHDTSFSGGYPIATNNGYIYIHDYGTTADGEAMEPFIEGSDLAVSEGNQYAFIKRLIPDIRFNGQNETPVASFEILRRNFPGQSFSVGYTSEVLSDTTEKFVRVRGRQFALRVSSSSANMGWSLGTQRLEIRPDGQKA
jgi:hypothetical protein